ncbi:hypothetical protein SAMN02927900_01038 [Rhizobium mongolense subsp. loessense]|uniref:Uncharacterized protein n=1 Tax=Rhizobium mongolense subsp. loessense TaxID=158890 RepID=A0A1G4PWT2_9HYPH|nr:hypothetical protein SAMN02927900_01038 [Rhizobium mongolense subsp. loessense]
MEPTPARQQHRTTDPIFRIFDVDKAMEFYCGFLGFKLDWEHRFGDQFPLYCQVSRGNMLLHLSEHSGDASPCARAFVPVSGVCAFQAELVGKNYGYMKPGLEEAPWGSRCRSSTPPTTASPSAKSAERHGGSRKSSRFHQGIIKARTKATAESRDAIVRTWFHQVQSFR